MLFYPNFKLSNFLGSVHRSGVTIRVKLCFISQKEKSGWRYG